MGCCGSNSKEPKNYNRNERMNTENVGVKRKNILIWGSFIALAVGIFFMLI